jgi:hypothetical protein
MNGSASGIHVNPAARCGAPSSNFVVRRCKATVTPNLRNVCLRWGAVTALVLTACGSGSDQPEDEAPDDHLAVSSGATALFSGDLVPPTDQHGDFLPSLADPGTTGAPKVVYLLYADGRTQPSTNPNPCRGTAPKFVCDFAPTLVECQRQIQAYLDKWYANFNIVFTLTRPTSGAYYTEVISSGGGQWCDAADNVAGIAPFLCDDLAGGIAYTFLGGKSAKQTAIIIAQEQAHLVGLEHTQSTRDIMNPTICSNCDGFENVDNKIQNDQCGRATQNSYQMMEDRLGIWTGGIKFNPFGCQFDGGLPLVQILSPTNNASVADSFSLQVQASDDCKVTEVTVAVSPMGLHAQSTASPFEWALTRITGRQIITVTARDQSGKESSASVTVNAPQAPGSGGDQAQGPDVAGDGSSPSGCDVGGCDLAGRTPARGVGLWASVAVSFGFMIISMLARRRSPVRLGRPSAAPRRH